MNLDKILGFRSDHQFSKDFPLKSRFSPDINFPRVSLWKSTFWRIWTKFQDFAQIINFQRVFLWKLTIFMNLNKNLLVWDWSGIGLALVWDWFGIGLICNWPGIGPGLVWDWFVISLKLVWDWFGQNLRISFRSLILKGFSFENRWF